jgi:predicted permease
VALATFLDNRTADLRWGVRAIRRAPGTTALAVLSLALGIGANTAIFSLVNAVLLKMLPVRAPHELHLVAANPAEPRTSWNYPDYIAFRDGVKGFSGLAAASGVGTLGMQVGEGSTAELVRRQFVSGNYFDVLGVRPAAGRVFGAEDDRTLGGAPYAVLSHDYWRARFGGDPGVVGRTIRLNGTLLTVVGVADRGFTGIDPSSRADLFVPMVMHGVIQHVPAGIWNTRHYWFFRVVGRVAAGTAIDPIATQLTTLFRAREEESRKADTRARRREPPPVLYLMPAGRGHSYTRSVLQTPLLVLMAVVGLVLLIACANVANIMLARGAGRQREIAIRLAVGAGRGRIASQLLTESLLVALLGGAAGVGLAYLGIGVVLDRFLPTSGWVDVSLDVSPDLAVLGFTLGVSVLTGVLAGLAPGWQATRPRLVAALKDDVPGRTGSSRVLLRRLLVVSQVALSLLLVVGAALFVRSLANLRALDAGFRREQTLIASVEPSRNGYKGQRLHDFYERLRTETERLPGVRSASLASITPLGGMRWNGDVSVEGRTVSEDERRAVDMNAVGPRYFETVGIPLVLGREFTEGDRPTSVPDPPEQIGPPGERSEAPGPRYVIVSESFARKYLAGGSPLGRRISMTETFEAARAYEVIGVVKDARYFGLKEPLEPMIYLVSGRGFGDQALCIRTTAATAGLTEGIRRAVTAIDPAVPLLSTRTIQQEIDTDIVQERLLATLAAFFGALALLLACVGLYGVISYVVARRTREIGIRLALGAQRSRVVRLVLADAGLMVVAGAAVGLAAALGLSRLVRSLLFGVSPQDPATVAGAVALLLAVTALAVLVPLRRALSVQPGEALRYE